MGLAMAFATPGRSYRSPPPWGATGLDRGSGGASPGTRGARPRNSSLNTPGARPGQRVHSDLWIVSRPAQPIGKAKQAFSFACHHPANRIDQVNR